MMEGTQLSMTDDGRLAVTKRAAGASAADRLRREADILRRAAHPGVVELLAAGEVDGATLVQTAFVGGGTLAEHLATPEEAATPGWERTLHGERGPQVAAALASTLADLHDRGIAHRRVTADHVLVTDVDQVRLCGFAGAAMSDDPGPCAPEAAAADVEAVAALVREMAAVAPGTSGALQAVADRVLLADPSARPSMRTLAQALDALTDGQAASTRVVAQGRKLLPARPSTAAGGRRPSRSRTVLALAVVATTVAAAVLATALTSAPSSTPRAAPIPSSVPGDLDQEGPTPLPSPPSVSTAPEPAGVRVWPRAPASEPEADAARQDCPAPATAGTADVDGDGCADVVAVADGIVSVGGRRWQVASPDDLVAVGDWDCDGLSTPAVVRPGTGSIWAFSHWALEDQDVVASAAGATAPGAVSAVAVGTGGDTDDHACHDLELADATGRTTRLHLDR
jgi:hypothetical protein